MSVRKALFAAALLLPVLCLAQKKEYNRFGMEIYLQEDGSYKLDDRFVPLLSDATPEGLYVPYESQVIDPADIADVEGKTVVYKKYGDRELKLEIYRPAIAERTPVMFFCHGGSWYAGSPSSMRPYAKYMCKYDGITTVNVQYSLSGQKGIRAEDAIQDYLDAIAYIRNNSEELNIDPDNLGFAGHSAGGHLSAVAAMKCPQARCYVSWAGVFNFNTAQCIPYYKDPDCPIHKIQKYYFRNFDSGYLAEVSPVGMVPNDRKPTVQLFYGSCDRHVETTQPEEFGAKLKEAGYEVDMQRYEYYAHPLHSRADKNREVWDKTRRFVREHLLDSKHTIDVNGVNLVYEVTGPESGRPVIIVHGNGGSHKGMASIADDLSAAGYRVYALDSRGQGENAPLKEYHYADMAEDVYCFIQKLGLGRPAVYGHSDGGIVAVMLEILHPGTAYAIAGSGVNVTPDGVDDKTLSRWRAKVADKPNPLMQMLFDEPQISPEQLRTIKVPALITGGTEDIIKNDHIRGIAAEIPDSELAIFDREGHGTYVHKKHIMTDILVGFLVRHGYKPF